MIPYDIDPSLHTGEPEPPSLDDGFSPPPAGNESPAALRLRPVEHVDPSLWAKSQF